MYPIEPLCKLFGVTKQAYYKYNEQLALEKAAQIAFALQYVHSVRAIAPGIGGVKLWRKYKKEFDGCHILGRDCFVDMLDEYDLKVRLRKRRPKTTDCSHGLPTYPNIVKEFIPTAPNQLWVSDITYIEMMREDGKHSFCYLSLISIVR